MEVNNLSYLPQTFFNNLSNQIKLNSATRLVTSLLSVLEDYAPVISGIAGTICLIHGYEEIKYNEGIYGGVKEREGQERRVALIKMALGISLLAFTIYRASPIYQDALKQACRYNLSNCITNVNELNNWIQQSCVLKA